MKIRAVIELEVEDTSPVVPVDGSTVELKEFLIEAIETIDGLEVMRIVTTRR